MYLVFKVGFKTNKSFKVYILSEKKSVHFRFSLTVSVHILSINMQEKIID